MGRVGAFACVEVWAGGGGACAVGRVISRSSPVGWVGITVGGGGGTGGVFHDFFSYGLGPYVLILIYVCFFPVSWAVGGVGPGGGGGGW